MPTGEFKDQTLWRLKDTPDGEVYEVIGERIGFGPDMQIVTIDFDVNGKSVSHTLEWANENLVSAS